MRQGTVIYPFEPWTVTETAFQPATNLRNETIFTVANGFIGMRGSFEEGMDDASVPTVNGTYLNGFYDTVPITYGEEAYGYARNHQYMLNVTDGKIIELYVDGEKFNMFSGIVRAYSRQLDMRAGCVTRRVEWESPAGKRVEIVSERMASLADRSMALIRYAVKPLNFSGSIRIVSAVNGQVSNVSTKGDPRTGSAFGGQVLLTRQLIEDETFGCIRQRTKNTGFELACAIDHAWNVPYTLVTEASEQQIRMHFEVSAAAQGEAIVLDKFIVYGTSKDRDAGQLSEWARQKLQEAKQYGYDHYKEWQRTALDQYWQTADIVVEGDEALQQGLRFNAYHLLQSAGRDGKTNIAAKGLTGEGYGGHYFWDTETYIIPFFQTISPDIAKQLLLYRSHILPKAKERAAELNHPGALYPWRTIEGEEASAYYPAGTAQYHINADIAYAIKSYAEATGDLDFLLQHGLEMLVETSRFFADLGCFVEGKGFCINDVTGPDEYTAIVNNNAYTNVMVKDQFEYVGRIAERLKRESPAQWADLADKLQLAESELALWREMAAKMYIHREQGLIGQDDSFLRKKKWDFERTPKEKYPLLLHYHPLTIYRHQVLKQADLVLAFYMQRDRFTRTEKARNFAYYEELTTHDSSLSACIYGIVAAELGYMDKAYDYFLQSVRVDLDDYHANTKDGVHCASIAGSRLGIVNGFAGMHLKDGEAAFEPRLPANWSGYRFRVAAFGRTIEIEVKRNLTEYRLIAGEPLMLRHYQERFELKDRLALPNAQLKAVVFDLDGVITDTAEYHYLAWKQLADSLGIPFDRKYNEKLKGVDRLTSLELLLAQSDQAFTYEDKLALAERKNNLYKELIARITPDDLLPGVKPLLEALRRHKVKIALGSASKNAAAVVDLLGVREYFDFIVNAAEVEISKPDPETFIRAAEGLGVHPAHCVGVEDAAAGIEALARAGIKSVGVGGAADLRKADRVVSGMQEIDMNLLQSMST